MVFGDVDDDGLELLTALATLLFAELASQVIRVVHPVVGGRGLVYVISLLRVGMDTFWATIGVPHSVSPLVLVDHRLVLAVRGGVLLGWVPVGIPVLCLPVGAYEATCLLEVRCLVQVLLATLDLALHASSGLGPLTQVCCCFLVATLISQLLVHVLVPDCLEALLVQLVGWVV